MRYSINEKASPVSTGEIFIRSTQIKNCNAYMRVYIRIDSNNMQIGAVYELISYCTPIMRVYTCGSLRYKNPNFIQFIVIANTVKASPTTYKQALKFADMFTGNEFIRDAIMKVSAMNRGYGYETIKCYMCVPYTSNDGGNNSINSFYVLPDKATINKFTCRFYDPWKTFINGSYTIKAGVR